MSGRGKGTAAAKRRKLEADYEWATGEDVACVSYWSPGEDEVKMLVIPLGKLDAYILKAVILMSNETLVININDSRDGNLFDYINANHVREIEDGEDEAGDSEDVDDNDKDVVLGAISGWVSTGLDAWEKTPPCSVHIRTRVVILH